MNKITVSICGSSATRGCFELHNLKDLNDIIDVVNIQYQSSFISLGSKPFNKNLKFSDMITNWNKTVIQRDLSKEYLEELKELQPQFIVVDFISDILYGTLKFGDEVITNNRGKLKEVQFEDKGVVFNIKTDYEAFINDWFISVSEFMGFVKENLPNTKVIIHSARFIRSYYEYNNTVRPFDKYDTLENNTILNEMERKLEEFNLNYINLNGEKYFSSERHKWKKNTIHYEQRYYRDFLLEFYKIAFKEILKK